MHGYLAEGKTGNSHCSYVEKSSFPYKIKLIYFNIKQEKMSTIQTLDRNQE